jgi:hypothetical protein
MTLQNQNTTIGILTLLFLLLTFILVSSAQGPSKFPVNFSFCKEMSFIPEIDSWDNVELQPYSADSLEVIKQWDTLSPFVARYLKPLVVRQLSGWAKQEMKSYKKVAPINTISINAIKSHSEKNKVVFESIVDTLPSHSNTVKRYLTLFILYDTNLHQIINVTITIRGERN